MQKQAFSDTTSSTNHSYQTTLVQANLCTFFWARNKWVIGIYALSNKSLSLHIIIIKWVFVVVTGKLPGYFTRPDKWRLGLKLNISRFYRAIVCCGRPLLCTQDISLKVGDEHHFSPLSKICVVPFGVKPGCVIKIEMLEIFP